MPGGQCQSEAVGKKIKLCCQSMPAGGILLLVGRKKEEPLCYFVICCVSPLRSGSRRCSLRCELGDGFPSHHAHGGRAAGSRSPHPRGRCRTLDDMRTMDPARMYEFSSEAAGSNVFDPLVRYVGKDISHLHPNLATSWKIAKNGKTYTFKLRHDVRFSNGPMTAADVVFSYRRLGYLATTTRPFLMGATAVGPRKSRSTGVKALNNYTVQFYLAAPDFRSRLPCGRQFRCHGLHRRPISTAAWIPPMPPRPTRRPRGFDDHSIRYRTVRAHPVGARDMPVSSADPQSPLLGRKQTIL